MSAKTEHDLLLLILHLISSPESRAQRVLISFQRHKSFFVSRPEGSKRFDFKFNLNFLIGKLEVQSCHVAT